jgi:hypothetical protein
VQQVETALTTILRYLAAKADIAELRVELRGEFAEKPSKTHLWGVLAVLLTAYACGLAALAMLK